MPAALPWQHRAGLGAPMASEDLTRALAAVLEGRGLQVQNWDSGPAGGKPPPPARLRANVSYVVLAVFLNEKVSGLLPGRTQAGSGRGAERTRNETCQRAPALTPFPRCVTPLVQLCKHLHHTEGN